MRLKSTKWFIIRGFLLVSFILMGIGFFNERAPVWVFYVGFALMLLIIPCAVVARFGTSAFFVSLAFLFGLMCLLIYDEIIIVPIIHKEYHDPIQRIHEEDDHLEEKNPPYIRHFVEKGNIRHGEYYFNKSSAIFGIDLGEATGAENKLAKRIYPTFRKAVEASSAFDCDVLPSVELIDGYCKYLDDRLFAGIEEYVHSGSSIYPGGIQGFLTALLTKLLQKSQRQGQYSASFQIWRVWHTLFISTHKRYTSQ
ncbi:MAG: hypothetical protein ACMUJM_25755 [bacterium]